MFSAIFWLRKPVGLGFRTIDPSRITLVACFASNNWVLVWSVSHLSTPADLFHSALSYIWNPTSCRYNWAESTKILYHYIPQWQRWPDELWGFNSTWWRILLVSFLLLHAKFVQNFLTCSKINFLLLPSLWAEDQDQFLVSLFMISVCALFSLIGAMINLFVLVVTEVEHFCLLSMFPLSIHMRHQKWNARPR